MKKIRFLTFPLFALLTSAKAQAAASFDCYPQANTATQVFENSTQRCGPTMSPSNIGRDGRKTVLCMIQAACKPVEATAQGPSLNFDEMIGQLAQAKLKYSVVVCAGTAEYVNGLMVPGTAICPGPTECQRDVFYNLGIGTVVTGGVGIRAGGALKPEGTEPNRGDK